MAAALIKENKTTLFQILFFVTLITSVFAAIYFIFISFLHYDAYIHQDDGCGWNLFGGASVNCELVKKYGPDAVNWSQFMQTVFMSTLNILDIIAIALLKRNNRSGFSLYTFSWIMYLIVGIGIAKYYGPMPLIVMGGASTIYYFLLKSVIQPYKTE